MLTHFNTDIPTIHFMGDRSGGTGAKKGVENKIAIIRCNL
jgi:hypothetical protein